jgi:hypothetical protein
MSDNKGKNKGHNNLIPCKKGETANPNGRPKGQRNYSTIYREALIRIGAAESKTPEELEDELLESGFKMAKKDYRFYKDVLDRIHGTATIKTDITSLGEKIGLTNEQQAKLDKILNDK